MKTSNKGHVGAFLHQLAPCILVVLTVLAGWCFFQYVDLHPNVEPHFFFAEEDPAYQRERAIKEIFPEPEQIIVAIKGPIHTETYQEKISSLSYDLMGLPEIFTAHSMLLGPEDMKSVFTSPLWKRLLVSKDDKATLIVLYASSIPPKETYEQIDKIVAHYRAPDFEPIVSGAPYVMDLIRKHLFEDLKRFSLAALFLFTLMTLFIFRSFRILIGTCVTCACAAMMSLTTAHLLSIELGPLTANLSTIVFILTLSHIVYLTFNWKHGIEHHNHILHHPVWHAIRITVLPSFWSMITTFLGFATLIFVEASPFSKLGILGSMGTIIAFTSAYLLYPWFLAWKTPSPHRLPHSKPQMNLFVLFLSRQHPLLTTILFVTTMVAAFGLTRIDRDPHLLSYFKEGVPLRVGLDYIDQQWGSSPLKLVIRDRENRTFTNKEVHKNLWDLQRTVENYASVSNMVSLSLIIGEGKERAPISFLATSERIMKTLEKPEYHEFASQFVTTERDKSLLILRIKSLLRDFSRSEVLENIKTMIWSHGFETTMSGGLYLLQGEMAKVVLGSLFVGLAILFTLFFFIGLFLSSSLHIAGAMFASLVLIPVGLLGLLGYLKVPLDMISAPATNIAISMGVDAMIHLLIMVRRYHRNELAAWDGWVEARMRLWKPILASMALVCAGFAIFSLSYFPPTQRFGLSVITGSMIAAVATLFILPTLAGTATIIVKKS